MAIELSGTYTAAGAPYTWAPADGVLRLTGSVILGKDIGDVTLVGVRLIDLGRHTLQVGEPTGTSPRFVMGGAAGMQGVSFVAGPTYADANTLFLERCPAMTWQRCRLVGFRRVKMHSSNQRWHNCLFDRCGDTLGYFFIVHYSGGLGVEFYNCTAVNPRATQLGGWFDRQFITKDPWGPFVPVTEATRVRNCALAGYEAAFKAPPELVDRDYNAYAGNTEAHGVGEPELDGDGRPTAGGNLVGAGDDSVDVGAADLAGDPRKRAA